MENSELLKQWPKKLKVSAYRDRWYVSGSITLDTIKNQIKADNLPGGKDDSGNWYVWVNEDLTPAFSLSTESTVEVISTGNSIADKILEKHKLKEAS